MKKPGEDAGSSSTLAAPATPIAELGTLAAPAIGPAGTDATLLVSDAGVDRAPVANAAAPIDDQHARYERGPLLGQGGMGAVWLTRDARIGRRVAMKVIRGDEAQARGLRARFLREARVQGQLEHPSIVPVYDLGTSPDGEVFFTMKRVRGVTLSSVIAGHRAGDEEVMARYTLRRLLGAFTQICLTIELANQRGVIHRDLKPDNLMLGEHGEVYVLDWGVARVLRDEVDEDEPDQVQIEAALRAQDDQQTALVGTPGYMAPEQLRGGTVGPGTDVFALGAILYELLSFAPLFGVGSATERMQRTLDGVDVILAASKVEHDLPPELVAVCARATALDPAVRFASARELANEVEHYLDGERDLALRRELAERHLAQSREAMRASLDDVEAHKRALRETGRALALVPDHPEAREIIISLFASSPTAVPREVEDAIEQQRASQSRITARGSALGMVSMLFFLPVLVLFGVRSWGGLALFGAMTLGAVGVSFAATRRERRSSALIYLIVTFNNLVFALCSGIFGPLVLVPEMVITNTITFALHMDGRMRIWAIASGCLAVAVPVLLGALGVLPSAYVPSGDGLLMRPTWISLPPTATLLFILVGALIAIANGARSVAQVRDALTVAERRLQMQAWQLQQLLPERGEDAPKNPG